MTYAAAVTAISSAGLLGGLIVGVLRCCAVSAQKRVNQARPADGSYRPPLYTWDLGLNFAALVFAVASQPILLLSVWRRPDSHIRWMPSSIFWQWCFVCIAILSTTFSRAAAAAFLCELRRPLEAKAELVLKATIFLSAVTNVLVICLIWLQCEHPADLWLASSSLDSKCSRATSLFGVYVVQGILSSVVELSFPIYFTCVFLVDPEKLLHYLKNKLVSRVRRKDDDRTERNLSQGMKQGWKQYSRLELFGMMRFFGGGFLTWVFVLVRTSTIVRAKADISTLVCWTNVEMWLCVCSAILPRLKIFARGKTGLPKDPGDPGFFAIPQVSNEFTYKLRTAKRARYERRVWEEQIKSRGSMALTNHVQGFSDSNILISREVSVEAAMEAREQQGAGVAVIRDEKVAIGEENKVMGEEDNNV